MRCGRLSTTKGIHAGYGISLTMVRERSWRMSLVVTKMPSFSNSKRYERLSSSHTTIRITGAHKRVTSTLQSILQGHHPMLCQTFAYLIERMIPDQDSQHQGFAPTPTREHMGGVGRDKTVDHGGNLQTP